MYLLTNLEVTTETCRLKIFSHGTSFRCWQKLFQTESEKSKAVRWKETPAFEFKGNILGKQNNFKRAGLWTL